MKKIISIVLALCITLSASIYCVYASNVTISGLACVDDLKDYSLSRISTHLGPLYENDLTDEELSFLFSSLKNENFVSTNSDLGNSTNYDALGYSSTLYSITFKHANTLQYDFRISRDYILIISVDGASKTLRHGEFKFADNSSFDKLSSFIQNCADEKYKKNEEDTSTPPATNSNIRDFTIIYSATFDIDNYKDFNWGICKYKENGETTPVTKIFCGTINLDEAKLLVINGTLEKSTNTVILNLKSSPGEIIVIDETNASMYKQEPNTNFVVDFSLQFNVSNTMTFEKVTATYKTSNTLKTCDINVDSIVEKGKLPDGFFNSKNNVNYEKEPENTEVETPKEETFEKPEKEIKEEKQQTVTEDKPEVKPEKEEVKVEEQDITEDKKDNTVDDENSDDTETDLKEETRHLFFSDVPKNHWAYNEIYDFAERQIVLGYGNGLFGVDDSITYEHFALLLERQLNYNETNRQISPAIREDVIVSIVKALKIDVSSAKEGIIDNTFTDCKNLKSENRKYIAAAIEKGLVMGSNAKLCPHDNLTRAETVILLSRAEKYK